jgi:hypothetical protein
VLIGLCRSHLDDFITAQEFGRSLKTLKGRSPYEYIGRTWTVGPDRSTVDPTHQMLLTEHLGMPPGASIFLGAAAKGESAEGTRVFPVTSDGHRSFSGSLRNSSGTEREIPSATDA